VESSLDILSPAGADKGLPGIQHPAFVAEVSFCSGSIGLFAVSAVLKTVAGTYA
jgi:hypothetical protein